MRINFSTEKEIKSKQVRNLPSGTVFILYSEYFINSEDRDYYIVLTRNGHREYYNLLNGAFKSFNDDCPVVVVDCALSVYGVTE